MMLNRKKSMGKAFKKNLSILKEKCFKCLLALKALAENGFYRMFLHFLLTPRAATRGLHLSCIYSSRLNLPEVLNILFRTDKHRNVVFRNSLDCQ